MPNCVGFFTRICSRVDVTTYALAKKKPLNIISGVRRGEAIAKAALAEGETTLINEPIQKW